MTLDEAFQLATEHYEAGIFQLHELTFKKEERLWRYQEKKFLQQILKM